MNVLRSLAFRMGNRLYRRFPRQYRHLFYLYKRISDRAEMAAMRKLVRPGMTCVDVGANIGFYTEYLSRLVGPTGMVFAFEPSTDNFLALAQVLRPNVRAVRAAVGADNGVITLYESDDMNVDHRTYPAGGPRAQVKVPLVTLDDAVPGSEIDFLKMDIQGYELHALKGMQRILRECRRLSLILEFWPWGIREAGGTPELLIKELESAGFKVRLLTGAPVKGWIDSPDWYTNVLATRE